MKQYYPRYKFQIYLLLFASIWLLSLNFVLQVSYQKTFYPDSKDYIIAAKNLLVFHIGHPNRPILIAFITGLPYLFTHKEQVILNWSLFINLICWPSSILLLFGIMKNFINQKIAFFFTVLFILCVGNSMYVFHLLTESIFTFVLLLFFYFLQKYYKTKTFIHLTISLSILILSMLIKPSAKIIAIIVVLYFSRILIINFKRKAMLIIYFSLSLVLVQACGIKYQFGNFTISYIDVVTAHNYLFSKAKCIEKGEKFSQIINPRADYLFSNDMKTIIEIAKADRTEQLKNNKLNLFKAYFSNLWGNIFSGTFVVFDSKNILKTKYFISLKRCFYLISFAQNVFLTIIGLFLGVVGFVFYKNTSTFFLIASLCILYVVGTSGISGDQGDRFHIVIYPLVLILIAKFYQKLIKPTSEPLHK